MPVPAMTSTVHHRAAALALALIALVLAPQGLAAALGQDSALAASIAGVAGVLVLALLAGRLWIGLLLLAPFALLAPLELAYVASYGKPSDAHVLGILAETDGAEAAAFVGPLALPMAAAVAGALLLAGLAVHAAWRCGLACTHRARPLLWAAALLALAVPPLFEAATPDAGAGDVARAPGDEAAEHVLSPALAELATSYPTGLPLRLVEFGAYRRTVRSLTAPLEDFRFGARAEAPPPPGVRELHVLVIGESSRPDRWQLGGYARPTTPRLAAEPNVVWLRDMVSPWAWTRMAVPVMLSRKPGTDRRPFFAERSLVAAFGEAGFRTAWYSTQSPLGPHDSPIAAHAQEADEQRYVNPGSYRHDAALDGELLPLLQRTLARPEPRQLIVLHTLGSHYDYSHRHPPDFERFKPSLRDVARPDLRDRGQREALSNAYDNSILYTDHVLAEAIAALRATGARATLTYVSDHGENLFDGACTLSGHGRDTERDFRVAAFVWHSDAWAQAQPQALAALRGRQDAPLSTENVFHSMLDAAGIRYPDERLSASYFHASWTPRPRIVQNGLDFDRARREPTCLSLQPAPRSAP